MRDCAKLVTGAALRASDPAVALGRAWIDPPSGPVFLAAFGKASAEMGAWCADRLGDRLTGGVVLGVPGRLAQVRLPLRVACYEADHPLPSERNVKAARALLREVEAFGQAKGGTVVCLISGGGSSHLTLPAPGLVLDELRAVSESLQRAGAPIHDLNVVRKHTELLKGGRLTVAAVPAGVESYIISDVISDRLDEIASGPTAPDPTTYADAMSVLDRWECRGVSGAVVEHLVRGMAGVTPETPKPGDPVFTRVSTKVIASNRSAVEGVRQALVAAGWTVASVDRDIEGEAAEIGVCLARKVASHRGRSGVCCVMGGEPTVRVGAARGHGGPSQELALACAIELDRLGLRACAGVIAFSSDGMDGPTDAAGACLYGSAIGEARAAGLNPERSLGEHDSLTFLTAIGAGIRTGPTGTNVNHIAVAMIWS